MSIPAGTIRRPPASPRRCRSRPMRIRTTCSRSSTKILPSPTSPVWPPSQSASIVGSQELVRHRDLEADLLGQPDPHGRAAVGLDAVELTAVTLHPAHREPSYLGAVEGFQHLVRLLGTDDPDNELHLKWLPAVDGLSARQPFAAGRRPSLSTCTKRGADRLSLLGERGVDRRRPTRRRRSWPASCRRPGRSPRAPPRASSSRRVDVPALLEQRERERAQRLQPLVGQRLAGHQRRDQRPRRRPACARTSSARRASTRSR